jgi:uncharacterized protein YuzE
MTGKHINEAYLINLINLLKDAIALIMNNPKITYFPDQDVIHLAMTDEDEAASMELSLNITAELNADGELIGVEILKASTFLRDFILESTQVKLMQASKRAG